MVSRCSDARSLLAIILRRREGVSYRCNRSTEYAGGVDIAAWYVPSLFLTPRNSTPVPADSGCYIEIFRITKEPHLTETKERSRICSLLLFFPCGSLTSIHCLNRDLYDSTYPMSSSPSCGNLSPFVSSYQ